MQLAGHGARSLLFKSPEAASAWLEGGLRRPEWGPARDDLGGRLLPANQQLPP